MTPTTPDTYEALLKAAGLDPRDFHVRTFVPQASEKDPALLLGRYGNGPTIPECLVVGHQLVGRQDGSSRWNAYAVLSAFPVNVMNQLTEVQRDRLRHASMDVHTPDGDKPASGVAAAPTEESRAEALANAPREPAPQADIDLPDSEVEEVEPEAIPEEVLDQLPEELRDQVG